MYRVECIFKMLKIHNVKNSQKIISQENETNVVNKILTVMNFNC